MPRVGTDTDTYMHTDVTNKSNFKKPCTYVHGIISIISCVL